MPDRVVYSLLESSSHPDFSALYASLGLRQLRFTSSRKAMSRLKSLPPDFVVAEFFYGYANNYAGVNISNLDVLLFSLQKYAPDARVIVLVSKEEYRYVDQLNALLPLHGVLQQPVDPRALEALLIAE